MISLVTGLLAAVCIALGAYMFGQYIVVTYRRNKREKAESRKVRHMAEVTMEHVGQVYSELKNPETRKAQMQRVAKEVCTMLKAGNVKLAEQFETTEPEATA